MNDYRNGVVMMVMVMVMTAVMAIGFCKCAYREQHDHRE